MPLVHQNRYGFSRCEAEPQLSTSLFFTIHLGSQIVLNARLADRVQLASQIERVLLLILDHLLEHLAAAIVAFAYVDCNRGNVLLDSVEFVLEVSLEGGLDALAAARCEGALRVAV